MRSQPEWAAQKVGPQAVEQLGSQLQVACALELRGVGLTLIQSGASELETTIRLSFHKL